MKEQQEPQKKSDASPEERAGLSAEDWVLLAAGAGFVTFLWILALLFVPLLTHRPLPVNLPPAVVEMAATRGFVLPPTWTPTPAQTVIPTTTPTPVYNGVAPTRMYTPQPTSLPGIPLELLIVERPNSIEVIDLARIMQGESPGDREAAYYVGWVAKNRLLHAGYGDTFAVVSSGFFGYRASIQPSEEFLKIARQVLRDKKDPTGGSLYALSRTDITKLGVSPQRADVTKGEWFFFRSWPLTAR